MTHGHFNVNGRATKSRVGRSRSDRIEVRDTRRSRTYFQERPEFMRSAQVPDWVSADPTKLSGSVIAEPTREQMPMEFNEQLVVEYYSR